MNFEFLTKIITIILNHQPWCWWWAMAGSAYCKIEVSIIFKYYPKIKLGCYYFTMYHVKLSLQHNIHEDYDDEILNYLVHYIFHFSCCCLHIMQNPNCFQDVFVFQKLNLLYWRRTDGCWCGEEERKGKKEKILKVTTDSPACVDDTLWI